MRRQFGKDKDQLFDKNLPLPPELSWENMEDGILAKMAAKKPFYKRPLFRWTGLVLVLGMVAWLALGDHQSSQEIQEYVVENDKPSTTKLGGDGLVMTSTTTPSVPTLTSKQNESRKTTGYRQPKAELSVDRNRVVLSNDLEPTVTVSNTFDLEKPNLIEQQPSAKATTVSKIVEAGVLENSTTTTSSQQGPKDQPIPLTQSLESTTQSKAISTRDEKVAYAVSQGIQTYNLPTSIATSLATPFEQEISFRSSRKPWRLLIQAGFNAFNSQYDGANAEITALRRSSEYFDPGTQLEIRLERRFKENWFFGAGIGHHTYRRKLDVQATSNIQRLYTDVRISYNEDPTTGEISNEVFADTFLNVTQLRKIKHFNRYQSWEIPIYVGYQHQWKRWNYAATLGLTASVKREMEGRVFDQDGEVGTLGQETFLPYDTEVSAAYQIEGRIGYRLLPSLDVHASLGRQNFIGNWMANSNNALTSRPGIWRLNFGTSVLF